MVCHTTLKWLGVRVVVDVENKRLSSDLGARSSAQLDLETSTKKAPQHVGEQRPNQLQQ